MNRFPDERFSEAQIDRFRDTIRDHQRENPNFCRCPRNLEYPPRFYRRGHHR